MDVSPLLPQLDLDAIRRHITEPPRRTLPADAPSARAATALVVVGPTVRGGQNTPRAGADPATDSAVPTSRHSEVKPPPSPGIVLIERTRRPDDPWSGQIALPGGRHHGEDRDPEETARRETREELGISLGRALGVLDDLPVHTGPATVVTPHVFHLESLPPLALDGREVASAWLAPIPELADPARRTTHHWQRGAERLDLPAIEVRLPESRTLAPGALSGETSHVLWGLTYRTVQGFLARCGAWPVPQTRP